MPLLYQRPFLFLGLGVLESECGNRLFHDGSAQLENLDVAIECVRPVGNQFFPHTGVQKIDAFDGIGKRRLIHVFGAALS